MRRSGMHRTGVIDYFEALRSDYNATKQTRFKRVVSGLPPSGSGADYHYRSDRQHLYLIELVRDFERNDPIIAAAFNRLVGNVLQGGFTLDPQTGHAEADKILAEKWREWSETPEACDVSGEHDWADMEQMAFRSVIRDGDIWAAMLASGRIRWYEAHRVRTPRNTKRNVVLGVLLDEHRRRKEVWVTKDDIEPWRALAKVGDTTPIPIRDSAGNRNVLQLYFAHRFSQTRGVSACAPSVDTIGMHDDIEFSKMVQQKIVSCYAIFRKRNFSPEGAGIGTGDGNPTKDDYALGMRRVLEEIYPGMIIDAENGESLEGFSPNVPNPEFFQHALLLLAFVAASLDLPLQVLLLDPTKTNFSGWRGAIDQARIRFGQMQRWLIRKLHRPVYRWKVQQWLAEDERLQRAVVEGANIFGHQWNPPTWQYIEPEKDARADALIVASNLNSRRRVLAKQGLEQSLIAKENAEDNGLVIRCAIEESLKINDEYADGMAKYGMRPVDWHEVAGLPLPSGYSMKLGDQSEPDEETGGDDPGDTDTPPPNGSDKK